MGVSTRSGEDGSDVSTNLVLDEELDALNGGSGRLGDGGGDTTHHEINHEVLQTY